MKGLKRIREDRGMTQAELGAKIGVSQGTVSFWEQGISAPTGDRVLRLAQVLKCTPNDLYGYSSEACV